MTRRQARFVSEYLKDLNGTQAAIRAGYSTTAAEVSASRLLRKGKVRRAVDSAIAARAHRVEVTADHVIGELYRLATVDIAEAFDDDGQLKPLKEMSPDVRRAIAGIEVEALYEGRGDERQQVGTIHKVKFWDKKAALELLGKHLGLFIERKEVSGTITHKVTKERAELALQRLDELRAQKGEPGDAGPH